LIAARDTLTESIGASRSIAARIARVTATDLLVVDFLANLTAQTIFDTSRTSGQTTPGGGVYVVKDTEQPNGTLA
jgi:hypothetical protein